MKLSTLFTFLAGLLLIGTMALLFGGPVAQGFGMAIGALVLGVLFLFVREVEKCAASH